MSASFHLWRTLAGPFPIFTMGLPAALWYLTAVHLVHLSPTVAVRPLAFRIFVGSAIIIALLWLGRMVMERSLSGVMMVTGILVMLAQGIVSFGWHMRGEAFVAEGEPRASLVEVDAGPWWREKPLVISLQPVPVDGEGRITLVVAGSERKVRPGESFTSRGYNCSVTSINRAPYFSIISAQGELVESAYVNLRRDTARQDFFQMGILPHRFYVTPVAGEADADMVDPSPIERVRLRIIRDKLTIIDQELARGKKVYFDGHFINFDDSVRWVSVDVERIPSLAIFWSGAFLFASGCMAGLIRHLSRR
jgi:hypothetical protein